MDGSEMFLLGKFTGQQDEEGMVRLLLARSQKIGIDMDSHTALRLVQNRETALRDAGRLEFGPGILPDLVKAFADSPFIRVLEDDLCALNEAFYQLKNETRERMSDEELLCWMEGSYNGWCKGSLELLLGRGLEQLLEALDSGRGAEVTDPRFDGKEVTAYDAEELGWWAGADENLD